MGLNHKIHIGFNFHVNFYHANKGDTNDDAGFERDLKMVRTVLEILDKANNEGQPVKAAWDFENEYTLGRILPSLGPDVIDEVKARLRDRGDELLLAGNHADLFAAMTGEELEKAVGSVYAKDALPDKHIKKVLGDVSGVIRTEGYIFSSAIIGDLKRNGVKAVLLGNSCIGPDALTTISSKLRSKPLTKYNPATYRNGEDSIILIPTYNPADVLDEGNLPVFLTRLRDKQISGEIDNDLFILFSGDVSSSLWQDLNIKSMFRHVHGTEGLTGFLKDLKKLDYIAYNTPSGYLKDHAPMEEIYFAGDMAQGVANGFTGYSERPSERLVFTRLERSRTASKIYAEEKESVSLKDRVRLLSASAFGPCSEAPFEDRMADLTKLSKIVQEKERKAVNEKEMSMRTSGRQRLNNSAAGKYSYSRRKDDEERNSFILMNPEKQKVVAFQVSVENGQCPDISTLVLECDDCKIESYTAIEMDRAAGFVTSVFVVMRFVEVVETCKIYYRFNRSDLPKEVHKPLLEIKPEEIPVFHAEGAMKRLLEAQGKIKKEESKDTGNPAIDERIAAMNQAASENKVAAPAKVQEKETYVIESTSRKFRIVISGNGNSKGKVREVFYENERIGDEQFLSSYIKCDGTETQFTCTKVENACLKGQGDGIKISGEIHVGTEKAGGNYTMQIIATPALKGMDAVLVCVDVTYPDAEFKRKDEVAPFQISPLYRAGISIIRRAFNGVISDYPISCFAKAVPENKVVGSFNNHLTAGIVGIKGALSGVLIGHARFVSGGMALAPGKLYIDEEGQHLSLNPYGTYGIQKRYYPTSSGGIMQKYCDEIRNKNSVCPAAGYSGVHEKFCLCLAGFAGATPDALQIAEMSAFCDGAVVCGDEAGVVHPFEEDNVILPKKMTEVPVTYEEVADPVYLKQLRGELTKHFYKAVKQ